MQASTHSNQLQIVPGDLQVVTSDVDRVLVLAQGRIVGAEAVSQVARILMRSTALQLAHWQNALVLLTHLNADAIARHCGYLLIVV